MQRRTVLTDNGCGGSRKGLTGASAPVSLSLDPPVGPHPNEDYAVIKTVILHRRKIQNKVAWLNILL